MQTNVTGLTETFASGLRWEHFFILHTHTDTLIKILGERLQPRYSVQCIRKEGRNCNLLQITRVCSRFLVQTVMFAVDDPFQIECLFQQANLIQLNYFIQAYPKQLRPIYSMLVSQIHLFAVCFSFSLCLSFFSSWLSCVGRNSASCAWRRTDRRTRCLSVRNSSRRMAGKSARLPRTKSWF